MPRNPHYRIDAERHCLAHPDDDLIAASISRFYVCRLAKGHEGDHVFVPVEMVIHEGVSGRSRYG